jgi:RNA polymerase sigma-70 factor, ECF subfamily
VNEVAQELLKEMIDAHGERVFRLALRCTGSRQQAEDIAQETFLRAFTHLDRFDQSRPAGPWLLKITLNLCRNWSRKNKEIPMELECEITQPGPEQSFLQRERQQELLRALHSLPEIYREVLILRHVSELSYQEICDVLGLELSLLKNRLYRGRMMLRDILRQGRDD